MGEKLGPSPETEPRPDLEYDLAHDDLGSVPQQSRPADEAVYVATETADYSGDYGYDLAHDVPGR